jgi:hypothetical protein
VEPLRGPRPLIRLNTVHRMLLKASAQAIKRLADRWANVTHSDMANPLLMRQTATHWTQLGLRLPLLQIETSVVLAAGVPVLDLHLPTARTGSWHNPWNRP